MVMTCFGDGQLFKLLYIESTNVDNQSILVQVHQVKHYQLVYTDR